MFYIVGVFICRPLSKDKILSAGYWFTEIFTKPKQSSRFYGVGAK